MNRVIQTVTSRMPYVPPKVRAAAEAEAIKQDPSKVLTAANFPTLGRTEAPVGTNGPPLDFLKRMKESEEERRVREAELAKQKGSLLNKSYAALEELGWAVLPITAPACRAAWNRICEREEAFETPW